jgi:hypothetical protein
MKYAKKILIAALVQSASASCAIKSGQIDVIQPLTKAWKLYNKQLAVNAVVDERIVNATAAKNAKAAAISASHAAVADQITAKHDAAVAGVGVDNGVLQAAIDAKYALAQTNIEARYQAALAASQSKHDNRQTEVDAQLVSENAYGAEVAEFYTEQIANVTSNAADLRDWRNGNADIDKSNINIDRDVSLEHTDTRDAEIRTRYNLKKDKWIEGLNTRYVGIQADLEAKKLPADATLLELDTAGAGGVAYNADCIVPVADAIAGVKAEKTASTIWREAVNGV